MTVSCMIENIQLPDDDIDAIGAGRPRADIAFESGTSTLEVSMTFL